MYLMLKEHRVINSIQEFMHLTIGQLKFFLSKRDEYAATAKKEKDMNERLKKK